MGFLNTPRFLLTHPLCAQDRLGTLRRYLAWQIRSRLVDGPVVCGFVNGTRLAIRRGMTGATGNVYAGLHEFEDMAFVLHLIREGDRFVDVGANVGSYTVLAASVGAVCEAFEPGSEAFAALRVNLSLNNFAQSVRAHQVAIGQRCGTAAFTANLDTLNHVVSEPSECAVTTVPMVTLDEVLPPGRPTLIKVDVEGYEPEVVSGAADVLSREETLSVLMEINGSASRYGFAEGDLLDRMREHGFTLCSYDPFTRTLGASSTSRAGNALFVKDREAVQARLREAPPFRVLGRDI
ncbi:MAG TPA: FkbM family methyltransferase [Rubricoccaceae bacterium]|nr:FkbM family methyltransferase [Rubricoccaceae bacterium]